jgi:TolB-like protein
MIQLKTVRTLALAGAAIFSALPAVAQDVRPTVMVVDFNNSAIGKSRGDYDALSKGIGDLLITAMSNNPNFRVVERDQLQAIMQEQNMAKTDVIDKATAIKLGKLLSAHNMVTGGFMIDAKGNLRLDARVVDVNTGVIGHTQTVRGKSDDIMSLIETMAEQLNSGLKLKSIELNRVGDAGPIQGTIKSETSIETKPATLESKMENKSEKKLDFKAAMLYSKALNHMDSGNTKEAEASFKAVLAKFPEFAPAKKQLSKLQTASGE